MRNAAAVLPVLMMMGCVVGPAHVKPEPPASASQPFVNATTAATAPLPEAWWRLFDDTVLDDLVREAIAANTDLRVASANLQRAHAALGEARNTRFPLTNITGGRSYGDTSSGPNWPSNGSLWSSSGRLAVSWEVDLFGRVTRAVEAAVADFEAVEAARDAVKISIIAETTQQYILSCALAGSLTLAEESAAIAGQGLALTTVQERAGAASRLAVERASVVLASTEADVPPLIARRKQALLSLTALLGRAPADVPRGALECQAPPHLAAEIPVGDGEGLLRRRPDLRHAERRLAADTARIGVAIADLYPKVSLAGSAEFLRNSQVRSSDSWTFGIGPLISWSIPNVGAARSRVAQAEAQTAASLAAFDGTVLSALREVEQGLSNLAEEQKRHDSLEQAQQRARAADELADASYLAGTISQFERLSASRSFLDSRAALAESGIAVHQAQVDLFRALGGGWQTEGQGVATTAPAQAGTVP